MAVQSYFDGFTALYPSSTTWTIASWSTNGSRCNVCHSSGAGTDINEYGRAFATQHNAGRTVTQAFQDIEALNSDASSLTNIGEINANAQPGWKPGATNSIYDPASLVLSNAGVAPPASLIGSADPAADTTPPTVIARSPAIGAAGVAVNTSVTATFSENVNAATVNGSTFVLRDLVNNIVPATVSFNGTNTATLTPSSPLAFLANYTATVVGGASGVKDLAGNALAANVVWSFTTGQSTPQQTTIFSAVLPVSRSAVVGSPVTVFGTIINAGASQAAGCSVALSPTAPAGLSLLYQTTDPATNQVIGSPNTPVTIAAGAAQSFVLALTPSAVFAPMDLPITFDCDNSSPAAALVGINTLLISASSTPAPDVVALAATLSNDGIVNIPGASGTGAFAVASVNVGAGGTITVAADTAGAAVPAVLTICQTNPGTGACLQPPAASVATTIANGATPTFAIFVRGTGSAVAFDPAVNRVFVRFREGSITGTVRGATSVAVRTVP